MVGKPFHRFFGAALAVLALCVAPVVNAQDEAKPADPVMLKRTYKAKRVSTYKNTIKTNVMGADIAIETKVKIAVKEIKEDGSIVIESKDEGGTISIMGSEQPSPSSNPTIVTRDKDHKVKEVKREAGEMDPFSPEVMKFMEWMNEPILGKNAVKPGDSWETKIENPLKKDDKFTVKTTFVGIEKVEGVTLWKFKQSTTASAGADDAKVEYTFTSWLDPKDGETVKYEGKVKDLPTQQFGPITFEVTLLRLESKDEA